MRPFGGYRGRRPQRRHSQGHCASWHHEAVPPWIRSPAALVLPPYRNHTTARPFKSDSGRQIMHGFAQRTLPLLTEPGLASPDGNKRTGKISRPSPAHFLQLYQALPREQKMLMRIKALVGSGTSKTVFLAAVHQTGLRSLDGKAYSWASLNARLQALQNKGLLDGTLDCIREIVHAVAADAGQSEGGTDLINAVKAVIPKSRREEAERSYYYSIPPLSQDLDLFRHLRLSVYANDEAGLQPACSSCRSGGGGT